MSLSASEVLSCELAGRCSGCLWIQKPYAEQVHSKREELKRALRELGFFTTEIEFVSPGTEGLRSRLDLTLQTQGFETRLGLYDWERSEIVDMKDCPMATSGLREGFKRFRALGLPSVAKGSLRIRVAPSGEWGVWIDFANKDIKTLLEEGRWLNELQKFAVVEIGQRNKRLIFKDGRWKLGDPELFGWFETYLGVELKPQNLYLPISGFTQTGFAANKALIEAGMKIIEALKPESLLELFCGCGNFTLPAASRGIAVKAIELDAFAIEGLKRAAQEARFDNSLVQVLRKDLYRIPAEELNSPVWLVDPPRSGLKSVVSLLEAQESLRPEHLVYVSCFLKSWHEDARRLKAVGYRLQSIVAVDQFPHSPHCEWVSHFSL